MHEDGLQALITTRIRSMSHWTKPLSRQFLTCQVFLS